ncbi:MAG TPA: response regulator [Candidatus Obscuribacterales bacterium]
MARGTIRVLLVEDNPADAKLFRTMLSASQSTFFTIERTDRLSSSIKRLSAGDIDLVLLDLSLPDGQGLDTFLRIHLEAPDVPVIVLSGLDDESVALEAVKAGAQDYLVKGQVNGSWLVRAIRHAIERHQTEHKVKLLNKELENRILELAALNKELTVTRDRALEASQYKSQFVAKISHEIRTPVSSILGVSELLARTELTEEQREFAEIINEAAKSLLSIINEVLDFSKVEAGKVELEITDFSIVSLVEGTAELLVHAARQKKLALMTFIDPAIPTTLMGDPVRLRQILLNFASNAIKFTDKGEVVLKATMESEDAKGVTVRLSVSDTGIGMTEAASSRLFQPFVQLSSTKYGGTGLGLSICKQLVDLMGGQIGLETIEGKGSQFWFSVRLARQAPEDVATGPSLLSAGLPLRDIRVLVIDDNATSRDILHRYVRGAGLGNGTAASAEEALSMLRNATQNHDPYTIAIIDLGHNSEGNARLAEQIKADPLICTTELVYITALDEPGKGEIAANSGFSGYLVKPVRQLQLMDCLTDILERLDEDGICPRPIKRAAPPREQRLAEVLVVEDSPLQQQVLVRQLKRLGLNAQVAANGRQAVEAAARKNFGLILMDLDLPEMDGLEATKAIRKFESDNESGRHTPIVAMTARLMEGDDDSCFKAGMDQYLTKPVTLESLSKVLSDWAIKGNQVQ